ncbi:PfkB family carbohydrate kinase [Massilia solisilvae]|uniref:PfkB family carbohydrate kinase n=1 Tax=Massilia solisilvae TaxID=1811225 RepID=A0ABT2BL18_9BURK|nr:PfkB family carbohydrate kinase [Massilia solisilvae]
MSGQRSAPVLFGEALVDDFGDHQVAGGAPFNVARHLAAFGERPLLVTRIGNDANGELVRAEFERFGMSTAGLQTDPDLPTGRVLVKTFGHSHQFEILPGQAYDAIDAALAVQALSEVTPSALYFGTLAQRDARSHAALAALACACPGPRFLDLNLRDDELDDACIDESLQLANVAKLSEDELAALVVRRDLYYSSFEDSCRELIGLFDLEAVLLTLGEGGARYVDRESRLKEKAARVQVRDTVGAGDAFSAVWLYGMSRGWSCIEMLEQATAFAGAICTIRGAVPQDLGFYEPWLRRWEQID